jgi:tetratricopeptide (TPR) repeat protein
MGCVYEPYLALTPNLELFFSRLFLGYGFAEAAYASQQAVSWQTTVVGDPLYRPYAKPLNMLQADLAAKKSQLTEWLGMLNVNRALLNDTPVGEVAKLMSSDTGVQMSAVLTEKLADLYREDGQREQSEETYRRALKLKPNRQQALRIRLRLAAMLRIDQAGAAAVKACLAIAEKHSDYVGLVDLLKNALVMARQADELDLVAKVEALLSPLVEVKDAK